MMELDKRTDTGFFLCKNVPNESDAMRKFAENDYFAPFFSALDDHIEISIVIKLHSILIFFHPAHLLSI